MRQSLSRLISKPSPGLNSTIIKAGALVPVIIKTYCCEVKNAASLLVGYVGFDEFSCNMDRLLSDAYVTLGCREG